MIIWIGVSGNKAGTAVFLQIVLEEESKMGKNRWVSLLFVIFYAITLLLVILNQNMLAMYAMAIGMLTEAIMSLVQSHKN